jgi:hypothetical protein
MKFIQITAYLCFFFIIYSCSKKIDQTVLDFDVNVLNSNNQLTTNFKVGDTVNFNFLGNPDHIVFFSGEKGRRYKFYDKVSDTSNNVVLKFTSTLTQRNNGNLTLLASSAFTGYSQLNTQDSSSILSSYPSSWTDISNRATWSTGTGALTSTVSLSDFALINKPIYLAFRYTAIGGVAQSSWTINALGIRHNTSDSSFCIDSTNQIIPTSFPTWVKSTGWGVVSILNPLMKFTLNAYSGTATGLISAASNASTSTFTIAGNTTAATSIPTDTWIITGPINLHEVMPDAGVTIKDMTTNASNSFYSTLSAKSNYAYIFKKPGTYEVSFLASTSSRDAVSSEVKTITITIN